MGGNHYFIQNICPKPIFQGRPRITIVHSISYRVPFANGENADQSGWTEGRNFVSDLHTAMLTATCQCIQWEPATIVACFVIAALSNSILSSRF